MLPVSALPPSDDAAASWQPDPFRRHELRFRDGELWTEHVSDRGIAGIDTVPVADLPRARPPDRTAGVSAPPTSEGSAVRVVPETSRVATDVLHSLLLVVEDRAAVAAGPEGTEQAIRDEHGIRIGTVRVAKERLAAHALRLLTTNGTPQVTAVDVFDAQGGTLLSLDRPTHLLTPRILVARGDGTRLGEIVPKHLVSGRSFTLEADGAVVGWIVADGPADRLLRVLDAHGQAVARVSTTWEVPSSSFHPEPGTSLVLFDRPVADPLHSLALAALLSADALLVGP